MTQDRVIEFLNGRGECPAQEIEISGLSRKAIFGVLTRLAATNRVTRREVIHNKRAMWAYTLVGQSAEPEHFYILRNLPRNS